MSIKKTARLKRPPRMPSSGTSNAGLSTPVVASGIGYQTQSIHGHLCRHGDFYGIRPKKLPSGRLVWPADTITRLLEQDEET